MANPLLPATVRGYATSTPQCAVATFFTDQHFLLHQIGARAWRPLYATQPLLYYWPFPTTNHRCPTSCPSAHLGALTIVLALLFQTFSFTKKMHTNTFLPKKGYHCFALLKSARLAVQLVMVTLGYTRLQLSMPMQTNQLLTTNIFSLPLQACRCSGRLLTHVTAVR